MQLSCFVYDMKCSVAWKVLCLTKLLCVWRETCVPSMRQRRRCYVFSSRAVSTVICTEQRSCSYWTWGPRHKLRCTWYVSSWHVLLLLWLFLHLCRLLKTLRIDSRRKRYKRCWRLCLICRTVLVFSSPAPVRRHHTETADGHMTSHDSLIFSFWIFNTNHLPVSSLIYQWIFDTVLIKIWEVSCTDVVEVLRYMWRVAPWMSTCPR